VDQVLLSQPFGEQPIREEVVDWFHAVIAIHAGSIYASSHLHLTV
jgi:hypothetical protein